MFISLKYPISVIEIRVKCHIGATENSRHFDNQDTISLLVGPTRYRGPMHDILFLSPVGCYAKCS